MTSAPRPGPRSAPAQPARETRAAVRRSSRNYRLITAWSMVVLLLLIAISTAATATSLLAYVQASFFAITVIGVGMAVYIGTRANE